MKAIAPHQAPESQQLHDESHLHRKLRAAAAQRAPANFHFSAMSTRRTRRTAATAEVTEEVITVETRAKRTRGGQRKVTTTKATSEVSQRETTPHNNTSTTRETRSDAVPAPATPAPATGTKRRLRSTKTEAASPLRALDEQPAKKQRTATKKAPAPAQPEPVQEESNDDTGIFFSKSEPPISYPSRKGTLIKTSCKGFDGIAEQIEISQLETRNVELEEKCHVQSNEISQLHARIAQLEEEIQSLLDQQIRSRTPPMADQVVANPSTPEFDSFNVEQPSSPEPATAAFTGDDSALALLRHVQEASKAPESTTPPAEDESEDDNDMNVEVAAPSTSVTEESDKPSTPTRNLFSSFTTPFTALKSLFGQSTTTPPPSSPTPSRQPPPDTFTEVLSMPPTPIGERAKRPNKKAKKPSRLMKALLRGIDREDADRATAWAKQIAADLRNDSTAGDKRKRLEEPVLFRDLKHLPASKPWQSGFSLPEDVLDLEDDDVVPAWAVYTSMVEEEEHHAKKSKTIHTTAEDDMPLSLNEWSDDFQPRRSIDPSPMFDTPLHHREGGNVFDELRGHDAAVNDRDNFQRELKAGGSQRQNEAEISVPANVEGVQGLARAHDPSHGSFSVPDSDSEEEEEVVRAEPVWTQAPPPAPTPSHAPLPHTQHNEEVERQRQKLMKHTPHKPSRLQQVSYPSPSLMSDAGNESILAASPLKFSELFGDIPTAEPILFGDAELDAAVAAIATSEALQTKLSTMNWAQPTITYDSDEEELSPI